MEKIGSYQYPNTKVAGALEAIRAFKDKLKGVASNKNALASALGYKSANNGAFTHKMMDLRKYGLIEGRGSETKLSELAKKILAPHNKREETEALKEMVFNIPLWKDIYEKYGVNLPSDIGSALQNITNGDRLEVDALKDQISKLYIDAVSNIGNVNSNIKDENLELQPEQHIQTSQVDLNKIRLDAGDIHLSYPLDMDSIDLIKNSLDYLRSKIQKQQKEKSKKQVDDPDGIGIDV
jgi:hypothetical protein